MLHQLLLLWISLLGNPSYPVSTPASFIVDTTTKQEQNKTYILSSVVGHKFEVEIYFKTETAKYTSNYCETQFTITNIGSKDFIWNENFTADTISTSTTFTHQVKYYQPHIVFEFKTTDGKIIDGVENIFDNIPVGKSSQTYKVKIKVGDKNCLSEGIPIRFAYKTTDK